MLIRSKAGFRALRESLGLLQKDVAEAVGVQVITVKRWEKPGEAGPSEEAWTYLERMRDAQIGLVDMTVDLIEREVPDGRPIEINYHRAEEGNRASVEVDNSTARAVFEVLEGLGYDTVFVYDGESAEDCLA